MALDLESVLRWPLNPYKTLSAIGSGDKWNSKGLLRRICTYLPPDFDSIHMSSLACNSI